jgi:hypothetical protein
VGEWEVAVSVAVAEVAVVVGGVVVVAVAVVKKLKSCQSRGAGCATPPTDTSIMSAASATATATATIPSVTSYELIFVRGIPFWHSNGRLFYYDTATPCSGTDADCIGAYEPSSTFSAGGHLAPHSTGAGSNDKTTGGCTLLANSELHSALAPRLALWRATLEPSERGKPITPVTKPSRARRTTTKSAKSSGSAASKE